MDTEKRRTRYRLYDGYDGRELLGQCTRLDEVRKLARERHRDTDGEWLPLLYKWDKQSAKYVLMPTWSY